MKRFAVVGQPISHSRSPEIFATLARESGIALTYERLEIAPDDFARVFDAARRSFDGWNVTAPHKERALANADEVSPNARAVGAANVVSFRGGRASVDNTDVAGVVALLRSRGIDPAGRPATILGAGGAARATALALRDLGASRVVVANRTLERAARLVADLRDAMGATELVAGEPEIAPLLINATSNGAAVVAAVRTCSAGGWCVDRSTNRRRRPFVRAARGRGATRSTGR